MINVTKKPFYDVKRELAVLQKNANPEWFGWYFDPGLLSWNEAKRQLEWFGKHIIPEFKG